MKMIDQVELLPLGTCAANLNKYQMYSAYLLNFYEHSENNIERKLLYQILLDVGNKRVYDSKWLDNEKLMAIFISHTHIDHTHSLGKLCAYLNKKKRTIPLTIYYPKHAEIKIKSLIRLSNFLKEPHFINFHPIETNLANEIIFEKIIVNSISTIHTCPTISYKFEVPTIKKKISCIYTPDTRYDAYNLIEFAQDADYWLLDTTFDDDFYDNIVHNPETTQHLKNKFQHSSPKYSAKLCHQANVKNYIAIHYYWKRFHEKYAKVKDVIYKSAKNEFPNNIIVSEDLKSIILE